MKKLSKKLALALTSMLLVLSACGGGGSTGGSKELTIAVDRSANNMNYLDTTEAANSDVIINFMEGLLVRDLKGELVPGVAKAMPKVSEDGLTLTFELRDTKWDNGEPVKAQDFVFAWRLQVLKGKYKHYFEYLKNGKAVKEGSMAPEELGVEAIDDKTLVVTLESPRTYFIELLPHMSMFPINEAFYNEVGAENFGTSAETVLANGAYKLVDYLMDTGWTFEKRADFWDAKNVGIEKITIRVVKEANTRASMWDSGEIDETYLSGDLIERYKDDKQLVSELDWGMYFMYISPFTQTPAPEFANEDLRKAIMYAIDREELTNLVLKDGSLPADFIIPNGMSVSGYDKNFRDAPGAFSEKLYNEEKYKKHWEAAKAALGDNITIPFTIDDNETNKKTFTAIQGQLEQKLSGLKVNMVTIPNQVYFPELYKWATPAARQGWLTDINDPTTIFGLFTSTSSNNFGRTDLTKYSELIAKSEGAEDMLDVNARVKDMVEAEKELLDQAYNIPLYQRGQKKLARSDIKGLTNELGKRNTNYRWVTR